MSPEVAALLEEAVGPYACNKRKMFGHNAYFINNNMWTGVFEDRIFVRLSPADRERLLSGNSEAVQFEPLPGRPMKEYIELPPAIFEGPDLAA
jgi:TfoX/Sxy family transcriptional regulator of competence genes